MNHSAHFALVLVQQTDDGRWHPVISAGVVYGETLNDALDLEQPGPGDVYGIWTMTGYTLDQDGLHEAATEKIRTQKPDFLITAPIPATCFRLEDFSW